MENGSLILQVAMQELNLEQIKTLMIMCSKVSYMKPLVYMLKQDDPRKCTAAKLAKFRLADPVKFIPKSTILLNPFSHTPVLSGDAELADSVCAIDCSWERASEILRNQRLALRGIGRRLPAMLAANPTNYAKIGKLSSAEALSGALYILNEKQLASALMDKFKWGHTFLELNSNLLNDYSNASTEENIEQIEREYFPQLAG